MENWGGLAGSHRHRGGVHVRKVQSLRPKGTGFCGVDEDVVDVCEVEVAVIGGSVACAFSAFGSDVMTGRPSHTLIPNSCKMHTAGSQQEKRQQ